MACSSLGLGLGSGLGLGAGFSLGSEARSGFSPKLQILVGGGGYPNLYSNVNPNLNTLLNPFLKLKPNSNPHRNPNSHPLFFFSDDIIFSGTANKVKRKRHVASCQLVSSSSTSSSLKNVSEPQFPWLSEEPYRKKSSVNSTETSVKKFPSPSPSRDWRKSQEVDTSPKNPNFFGNSRSFQSPDSRNPGYKNPNYENPNNQSSNNQNSNYQNPNYKNTNLNTSNLNSNTTNPRNPNPNQSWKNPNSNRDPSTDTKNSVNFLQPRGKKTTKSTSKKIVLRKIQKKQKPLYPNPDFGPDSQNPNSSSPFPRPNYRKLDPQLKVNLKRRSIKKSVSDDFLYKRILKSPQLSMEGVQYPLLSSCLSPLPLAETDKEWIEDNVDEIKYALGYPLEEEGGKEGEGEATGGVMEQLDTLLFLSYMHRAQIRRDRHLKVASSRLAYLGQYVTDLAITEYLLQRYPREVPASLRERAAAVLSKKTFPRLLMDAGLDRLIFPDCPLFRVPSETRETISKSVFMALIATAYLTRGMREVYRILFEVFGIDPDSPEARPRAGRPDDEDFLVPELDGEPLTWRQVANYQPPHDSLFAHPRLFRTCVPPGIRRFRGHDWFFTSLRPILDKLAYPRPSPPSMTTEVKQARNEELILALQLCFTHSSLYKLEHPRFCNERLEYLGSKIQDLVLAERLLLEFLDGPILWLEEKHGSLLRNSLCGRYLREKKFDNHILKHPDYNEAFEKNRRMRVLANSAIFQSLHAVGYLVYGKPEVRRLMFGVWDLAAKGALTLESR